MYERAAGPVRYSLAPDVRCITKNRTRSTRRRRKCIINLPTFPPPIRRHRASRGARGSTENEISPRRGVSRFQNSKATGSRGAPLRENAARMVAAERAKSRARKISSCLTRRELPGNSRHHRGECLLLSPPRHPVLRYCKTRTLLFASSARLYSCLRHASPIISSSSSFSDIKCDTYIPLWMKSLKLLQFPGVH